VDSWWTPSLWTPWRLLMDFLEYVGRFLLWSLRVLVESLWNPCEGVDYRWTPWGMDKDWKLGIWWWLLVGSTFSPCAVLANSLPSPHIVLMESTCIPGIPQGFPVETWLSDKHSLRHGFGDLCKGWSPSSTTTILLAFHDIMVWMHVYNWRMDIGHCVVTRNWISWLVLLFCNFQ